MFDGFSARMRGGRGMKNSFVYILDLEEGVVLVGYFIFLGRKRRMGLERWSSLVGCRGQLPFLLWRAWWSI